MAPYISWSHDVLAILMLRISWRLIVTLLSCVALSVCQSPKIQEDQSARDDDDKRVSAVSVSREGLLLSTPDESCQLRAHGYLQAEAELFQSDLKGNSPKKLGFRRIRPIFEANLFKTVDFRLMPDFGLNNPVVQEFYAELRLPSIAKLRVGKFKTPLGLEVLRLDRVLTFAERALDSNLLPVRDVGAQVSGVLLQRRLNYAAGYFNGTKDGSNANFEWNHSGEAAARVFAEPFLTSQNRLLEGLGLGLAGSAGYRYGSPPSYRTMGGNTFFKYSAGTSAGGEKERLTPQGYYYYGPVGIVGEYIVSSQVLHHGLASRKISNNGWQLAGSVVLTGEKNSYNGVSPTHGFEPYKGLHYLGAWEVGLRYSTMNIESAAFPVFANPAKSPNSAQEWVVGVNWYVNRYIRVVADWEHTDFQMISSRFTPPHPETLIVPRIQLEF